MNSTDSLASRLEKKAHSDKSVTAETAARLRALEAALRQFVAHFGPLEDNHMIHEDARKCFKLARAALGAEEHDKLIAKII